MNESGLFQKIPEEQEDINEKSVAEMEIRKSNLELRKNAMVEYKRRIDKIVREAKARLETLDGIKKEGHRDSTEYTNMRDALVAVTRLSDRNSQAETLRTIRGLQSTSAEYIRTRDVFYRSFRTFGERRLDVSKGIAEQNDIWLDSITNATNLIMSSDVEFDRDMRMDKQRAVVENSITSYNNAISRKQIKYEDLNKSNKGKEKVNEHRRRIDLRAVNRRSRASENPGMEGPEK